MIKSINSKGEFDRLVKEHQYFLLLFYTNNSETSLTAKKALEKLADKEKDVPIFSINAKEVREIHTRYGVKTVPTVLVIKKGKAQKQVQGALSTDHYSLLLTEAPSRPGEEEKPGHSVVVYTTPVCPWCNRVKTYLRQNRVRFREVDVSRDTSIADELVRRSGQTGVPQIDIDGTMIVGFDQAKIDAKLGIGKAA